MPRRSIHQPVPLASDAPSPILTETGGESAVNHRDSIWGRRYLPVVYLKVPTEGSDDERQSREMFPRLHLTQHDDLVGEQVPARSPILFQSEDCPHGLHSKIRRDALGSGCFSRCSGHSPWSESSQSNPCASNVAAILLGCDLETIIQKKVGILSSGDVLLLVQAFSGHGILALGQRLNDH